MAARRKRAKEAIPHLPPARRLQLLPRRPQLRPSRQRRPPHPDGSFSTTATARASHSPSHPPRSRHRRTRSRAPPANPRRTRRTTSMTTRSTRTTANPPIRIRSSCPPWRKAAASRRNSSRCSNSSRAINQKRNRQPKPVASSRPYPSSSSTSRTGARWPLQTRTLRSPPTPRAMVEVSAAVHLLVTVIMVELHRPPAVARSPKPNRRNLR